MGSIITLGISNFEIDWGKNHYFNNHSKLFLPSDKKHSDYYYADNIVEKKNAYCRKLKDVKKRLELLGYTLISIRKKFKQHLDSYPEYYPPIPIDFDTFVKIVRQIDISKITRDNGYGDYDFGEYVTSVIFKIPESNSFSKLDRSTQIDLGMFFENMDSYITLYLLAGNPNNDEYDVIWRYYDIVEGGYISEEDVYESLTDEDKFLIVTEGSSDTYIIQNAIRVLHPDICDFFRYIDMADNYPFTGTGNLYRFCQGLVKIGITNKVLVIYDNDLEGIKKYNLTKNLNLPSNINVMKLPNLKQFRNFLTVGPSGYFETDINGKAVSIECFLDLNIPSFSEPTIRWKVYNEDYDQYHGALKNKEVYIQRFKNEGLKSHNYDWSKLEILTSAVYKACTQISDNYG